MAKKSWKRRNAKRLQTVKKFEVLRSELKKKGDYIGLSKLPRNASPVRLINRCKFSGRKRGFIRKYGVSRITFREAALAGLIPGVIKASW